jgi:ribose 5-phosphate isomerase B
LKISIGSDHAGFEYKERLVAYLRKAGHDVTDHGTTSAESTDYPLFIIPAAEAVVRGEAERGIVLGGSGNGEAIAANKVKGVRCALCWNDETAELSRRHNNSNVLSLGQRMISFEIALRIVDIWLATPFDGGRHARRVAELDAYEAGAGVPGMKKIFTSEPNSQ